MHGPPLLSHWRAEHGHEASCSDHDDRAACHASYTDYPVAPEGAPERAQKMEAMLKTEKTSFLRNTSFFMNGYYLRVIQSSDTVPVPATLGRAGCLRGSA